MPRKPSIPKVPKPKPLLTRPEVVGLCKRFLKPDAYDAKMSPIVLYRLLKQYPSAPFWLARELDWQPDNMFYFLSAHGQAWLKDQWDLFHLDMPAQTAYTLESTKVGEDVVIESKPRTVAELLK